jgi:hypothetical protein
MMPGPAGLPDRELFGRPPIRIDIYHQRNIPKESLPVFGGAEVAEGSFPGRRSLFLQLFTGNYQRATLLLHRNPGLLATWPSKKQRKTERHPRTTKRSSVA